VSYWKLFLFAMSLGFDCAYRIWWDLCGRASGSSVFRGAPEHLDECGDSDFVAAA
jgi:hypothetical protein